MRLKNKWFGLKFFNFFLVVVYYLFRPSYPPPRGPLGFSLLGTASSLSGSVPAMFEPTVN